MSETEQNRIKISTQPEESPVQKLLELAVQEQVKGNLTQAEAMYQQILIAAPNQVVALHMLGLIAYQSGNSGTAEELITKALKIQPTYTDAHINLGYLFSELGRLEEAAECYDNALALNPDDADVLVNRANLFRKLGYLEKAVLDYKKVLALRPTDPEVLINLGALHSELGQFEDGADIIRKAITQNPNIPEAHTNLGICLMGLDQFAESIVSFHNALQLQPNSPTAHNNLGNALHKMGSPDKALVSYREALALAPGDAEVIYNIGDQYLELGQTDEAAASFREALTIKPDYIGALISLHACLYGDENLEEAAECLETVLKFAPDHLLSRFYLGMLRDHSGDSRAAAEHFERLKKAQDGDSFIDSWNYVKSAMNLKPHLFGPTIDGLTIGLDAARVDGLVMEFGVRFGTTIRQISDIANQDVHGFDTFQGLPEAWLEEPEGAYSTLGELPEVSENVHLHVGLFEDSLPPFLIKFDGPVRFMNVDCDLYSSTKMIFDHLSDRIVSGTILVFDEYLLNSTWREDEYKAFQESVEKFGWTYEYLAFSLFSKQAVVRIR